jgi:hypothetical protein
MLTDMIWQIYAYWYDVTDICLLTWCNKDMFTDDVTDIYMITDMLNRNMLTDMM